MKSVAASMHIMIAFAVIINLQYTYSFSKLGLTRSSGLRSLDANPSLFPTMLRALKKSTSGKDVVEEYFNYWNLRDMDSAINLFDIDCTYEDTLYPGVFQGRETLKKHLFSVADSLPTSFKFCLDVVSEDKNGNIGVQWHVENDDKPLPFTRGCSMYKVDMKSLKITEGFDVPEPVAKTGAFSLFILKSASGFIDEPRKLIPFGAWIFYCWFLFISNVAPGPNALQLDSATWKEVLDLSHNFWLIIPIGFPQLAVDTVSPVLEGIFNLLLAWAGLYAGFIVDGKQLKTQNDVEEGENKFILPAIVMQFLTNAAYLPYLFTRKTYNVGSDTKERPLFNMEDLSPLEKVCESKGLPLLFGTVGIISIAWGLYGRLDQYSDVSTRIESFTSMMNTDRLGFSFVIDLLYFSVFQGWLINDDLLKRGLSAQESASSNLSKIGSSVPFFGLIYYLLQRPSFPKEAVR
jgi:SnoaL-like domain